MQIAHASIAGKLSKPFLSETQEYAPTCLSIETGHSFHNCHPGSTPIQSQSCLLLFASRDILDITEPNFQ